MVSDDEGFAHGLLDPDYTGIASWDDSNPEPELPASDPARVVLRSGVEKDDSDGGIIVGHNLVQGEDGELEGFGEDEVERDVDWQGLRWWPKREEDPSEAGRLPAVWTIELGLKGGDGKKVRVEASRKIKRNIVEDPISSWSTHAKQVKDRYSHDLFDSDSIDRATMISGVELS
ncbi:hypothetical protein CRG98_031278 [Punica granatum]|uniref:Uncharacterized protein n=1 Tax=Punica granatum TaxID=22663 RepID=A0A2I0IXD3_PUNGR|nr:hypothetical protein CRG98_031278 [Punica granatum]